MGAKKAALCVFVWLVWVVLVALCIRFSDLIGSEVIVWTIVTCLTMASVTICSKLASTKLAKKDYHCLECGKEWRKSELEYTKHDETRMKIPICPACKSSDITRIAPDWLVVTGPKTKN